MSHSLRLYLLSAHLLCARPLRPALGLTLGLGLLVSCGGPSGTTPPAPATGSVNAPANFAVTAATASSVTLSWTAVSGATGYVLERREGGGAFKGLATPAADATTYVDGGLTAGTTYVYRLKVKTATLESPFTTDLSAVPSFGGTDTDGDGIADADERAGYDVTIKEAGVDKKTYHVTSDPTRKDTDGDGLSDGQERALFTDPGKADTDEDGLPDAQEINTWASNPNDRDTDGDAQGNPALFDGQEVNTYGTSPTLKDSDGDKYSDYEEIIVRGGVYNPLVANTPRLELSVATAPSIDLNVVKASDHSLVRSHTASLALGTQDSRSATDTQTQRVNAEISATASVELSEGSTGVTAKESGSVTVTAGYGYETTASYTTDSVHSAQQTAEDTSSESSSTTNTLSGGKLNVGFKVKNTGDISFNLTDLQITALRRDPAHPTNYLVVGSMGNGLVGNGTVLSSGQSTGTLTASLDLNSDLALALMQRPQDLLFEFSAYNLLDDQQRNYQFLKETTNAQTALVVIDYGNGDIVRERVATNVQRAGGQIVGVKLAKVLKDILKLPYATSAGSNNVQVLKSLRDNGQNFTGDVSSGGADHSLWATVGSNNLNIAPTTNFDDITLTQNSEIRLIRVQDRDQDHLLSNEEYLYGTDDAKPDSDGDGLSDYDEARVGWTVTTASPVKGYPRKVYSNPVLADSDGDGLSDAQEKVKGTDPLNPDTDRDRQSDRVDPGPLDPAVKLHGANPTISSFAGTLDGPYLMLSVGAADTDGDLASVEVDWGDGTSSSTVVTGETATASPTHRYSKYSTGKTFTVTVDAVDSDGLKSDRQSKAYTIDFQ